MITIRNHTEQEIRVATGQDWRAGTACLWLPAGEVISSDAGGAHLAREFARVLALRQDIRVSLVTEEGDGVLTIHEREDA